LPGFEPTNDGDDGLSATEVWKDDSIEEAELGYRKCPRVEKVGVTGEGISDAEEFGVQNNDKEWSISESDILSLFLRSSTNCGSKSGLSLGDIIAVFGHWSLSEACVDPRASREVIE